MDNKETYALSCIGGDSCRASTMMKKYSKRGKRTMSDEHKQKIIDGRMRKKKKIADGYLYLDLVNVRIVRPDELNYEVQQKNGGGTWPEGYFYGSPEEAIQKVCSLVLASVDRAELQEFLNDYREKIAQMMERVMEKK
jgi:hypothetical protein